MMAHIKRTCSRRGMWQVEASILCCAFILSLFGPINFVGAAPLTHFNSSENLTDAWEHKELAGTKTFTIGPPEGLSEIQEGEWAIGAVVGGAELCGYYGQANKIHAFMKKSVHYRRGYKDMSDFDFSRNCSEYPSALETILNEKETFEKYLDITYPD